jgi:L-ascorbate metabolism protein UlaG (beta-lactamase superfamily)
MRTAAWDSQVGTSRREGRLRGSVKRKIPTLLASGAVVTIAAVLYRYLRPPSLKKYRNLFLRPSTSKNPELSITWMGVTTALFDDGKTRLLSDGYFSRPSRQSAFLGSLGPDHSEISAALARANITNLDAVFVAHSHFDHALDSPVVASLTGAELLGSESTGQIARGYGFEMDKFRSVKGGDTLQYGNFKLTVFEAPHSPHPISPGEITEPVVPAADHNAYRLGRNFNFRIEHRSMVYLLQQSANFERGLYQGIRADLVFLAIGALGKQSDDFIEDYWKEVVLSTQTKKVILTHWDDFNRPVGKDPKPLPLLLDHFARSMEMLLKLGKRDGVEVFLPVAFQTLNPRGLLKV